MRLTLLLIAGLLAACQGTASGMGSAMHGMSKDNWYAMCGVVRRIADAPTPEDRQALVDKLMPDMSPASRDRHLRKMGARCGQ